jgi:hypothetical protein
MLTGTPAGLKTFYRDLRDITGARNDRGGAHTGAGQSEDEIERKDGETRDDPRLCPFDVHAAGMTQMACQHVPASAHCRPLYGTH